MMARLLPPEVDLRHPERGGAARPVWLGVVWSRLGRGDLAWQFWDRVTADAVQPWIAAERGRVLRELGLHAAAERLEWPAVAAAEDPGDRAMLQVSLVADAVGRGDVAAATRRLEVATQAVGDLPDGPRAARQRLRLTWVGVEVAWLTGSAPSLHGLPVRGEDAAVTWPDEAHHGSDFHRAKALLFGGLVHRSVPLLDLAAEIAPPVLAWAVHLARADHGCEGAETLARDAWTAIEPPAPVAEEVAATPTAHRLTRR